MANYFDLLKTLYTKEKLAVSTDIGLNIALTKTLEKDTDNLPALSKVVPFLYDIAPKHYFYLLYLHIPRKGYVPRLIKMEKDKLRPNKLLDKIQYVLGWSNRERRFNKDIIEKTIVKNQKYWSKELGVK